MMLVKVNEASGPALDWLVAKCAGDFALYHDIEDGQRFLNLWTDSAFLHYSSNWANGGPIIEREQIEVSPAQRYSAAKSGWQASILVDDGTGDFDALYSNGPTPLIAAMRCYVSSKMGDMVEVPEELL